MKALTKTLAEALRTLSAGPTWTITMVDNYYASALKLKKLGLVEFKPRFIKRGKFRGQPNGYDVVVTAAGRRALEEVS
jgi:hypothetical protein